MKKYNLTDDPASLGVLPSKHTEPLFRRCPSGKGRVCTSDSTHRPSQKWRGLAGSTPSGRTTCGRAFTEVSATCTHGTIQLRSDSFEISCDTQSSCSSDTWLENFTLPWIRYTRRSVDLETFLWPWDQQIPVRSLILPNPTTWSLFLWVLSRSFVSPSGEGFLYVTRDKVFRVP